MRFVFSIIMLLFFQMAWASSSNIISNKSEGYAVGSADFSAMLEKQIKQGVLKTETVSNGFSLSNDVQSVAAYVTQEGVIFKSIGKQKDKGGFSLSLSGWGRESDLQKTTSQKLYREGDVVFHEHKNITERFTNTGGGIRQDFIVQTKPEGEGDLHVQLNVGNATLKNKNNGVIVILNGSNRELTYDRLAVMDSSGKTIPASIKIKNKNTLDIVVNDVNAKYPLTIDPTVGDENWVSMGGAIGTNDSILSAVNYQNGFVIAGKFTSVGGISANRIAMWDGQTWSSLNFVGNADIRTLAVDSQNNIYAVTFVGIYKWNKSTWTLMSSIQYAWTITIDKNDNIYIGGFFNGSVAKWDGSQFQIIGSNGIISCCDQKAVYALATDSHGNLYVGGNFSYSELGVGRVAKWDGNTWSYLNGGVYDEVYALAVDKNDNLYVGGRYVLQKWDGVSWTDFSLKVPGYENDYHIVDYIRTLKFDNNGKLYAGALSNYFIVDGDNVTRKLFSYGSTVEGIAQFIFDTNNNLYVAGLFSQIGNIAKWDGETWIPFNSTVGRVVYALAAGLSGEIYAAGDFLQIDNLNVNHIAKWDGVQWTALNSGTNGPVYSLHVDKQGNLYAGGSFSSAGGVQASNVAKWNGSQWSNLGDGLTIINAPLNTKAIIKTVVSDSKGNVYAGGLFNYSGATPMQNIAKWDGITWRAMPGLFFGYDYSSSVTALVVNKHDTLYLGGEGMGLNPVQWSGGVWQKIGSGLIGSTLSMTFDSQGNLYAAGNLYGTAGVEIALHNVAKWNGEQWSSLGGGVNNKVTSVTTDKLDNVYVTGVFTLAGGQAANKVAKWNGTTWSSLGSGISGGINNYIQGNALINQKGLIFVGGGFNYAGGLSSNNLAQWRLNSDLDSVPDINDNCWLVSNNDQLDTDHDSQGNACDSDDDNDGILDTQEVGLGTDPLDTDSDNDGFSDLVDAFPLNVSEHMDTDNDGIGNNADMNDDNDAVPDLADAFPLDPTESVDTDGDGVGNNADALPLNSHETVDTDHDGVGNNADTDDDNDDVADTADIFPLNAMESVDTDHDGVGNNTDEDDDNDGAIDTVEVSRGTNPLLVDTDGDSVNDLQDNLPLNATETLDTDHDGVGNNADTNDDNDSVADVSDVFPLDATEWLDSDHDGIGNNADTDDDNDGVADLFDVFPFDVTKNANAGNLDRSFGNGGWTETSIGFAMDGYQNATGAMRQQDGKFIIFGSACTKYNAGYCYTRGGAIVRYTSNGLLDSTFNGDGKVTTRLDDVYNTSGSFKVGIEQKDKKLVFVGAGVNKSFIVRYESNGFLDGDFGIAGKALVADIAATDIVELNSNQLLIVGKKLTTNNLSLQRYSAQGVFDTSFGVGGTIEGNVIDSVTNIGAIKQANGSVVVLADALYRYNEQGILDESFGIHGKANLPAANASELLVTKNVFQQKNGKLVVTGIACTNPIYGHYYDGTPIFNGGCGTYRLFVARYTTAGVLDVTFNSTGYIRYDLPAGYLLSGGNAAEEDAEGNILVSGTVYVSGVLPMSAAIWRFKDNGQIDDTFGDLGQVIHGGGGNFLVSSNENLFTVVDGFGIMQFDIYGDSNPNFGDLGQSTTTISANAPSYILGITQQKDGKLLAAGTDWNPICASIKASLVRFLSNGLLDASFGENGVITADNECGGQGVSVVEQQDGKIVYLSSGELKKYSTSGQVDTGFGVNGKVTLASTYNSYVYRHGNAKMLSQLDGRLVLAMNIYNKTYEGTPLGTAVVRLTNNGLIDTTFANSGINTFLMSKTAALAQEYESVSDFIQLKDGKFFIVGNVCMSYLDEFGCTDTDFSLARLNANGTLDTSFSGDGKLISNIGSFDDIARAAAQQSDGKILVAGSVCTATYNESCSKRGLVVARYTTSGSLDTSFGTGGKVIFNIVPNANDDTYAVSQQADGKILVAFNSSFKTSTGLLRLNSNGSFDTTFGVSGVALFDTNAGETGFAMLKQSDGNIMLAGGISPGQGYEFDHANFLLVKFVGGDIDPNSFTDTDGDSVNNDIDTDDDNDGVFDVNDAFPLNAAESVDSDHDSTGNNADTDDDNDGVLDQYDSHPLNNNLQGVKGSATTSGFGSSVSYVGDVNSDGYGDYIVGAYLKDIGALKDAGQAQIISGKTGQALFTFNGDATKDYFGFSVAGVGDVNGDNTPDVAVGAYLADKNDGGKIIKDAGSIKVFSGINGSLIYQKWGASAKEYFGFSVAGIHDVDGDGKSDVVVGVPLSDKPNIDLKVVKDTGSIQVFTGAIGTLYRTYWGDNTADKLGWSVAYAGDIDKDAYGDVIVGAPFADSNGKDSGLVRVYSPNADVPLTTLNGASIGDNFGSSVSGAGDVNKDGTDDVIIGEPKKDVTAVSVLRDAGGATIYSGANWDVIYQLNGGVASEYFGYAVAGVGDFNNDGYDDVIVGAYAFDAPSVVKAFKDAGKVTMYSGATGSALFSANGTGAGDYFGWSVSGGDTNHDDVPDILVGAVKDDIVNDGVTIKDAGSTTVISGVP